MQITFNTESELDRRLIQVLLKSLSSQKAQPEVAKNTGSEDLSIASSDDLADSAAVSVSSLAEAAAAVDPPKKKTKHVERKVTLEQTIDELEPVTYPPNTFEGVKYALGIYTNTRGVPEGIKLLGKFNASRISELNELDYEKFNKECIDGAR